MLIIPLDHQFSVQQVFSLWNWDCFKVWNFLIFEVVKLCRMNKYLKFSYDAGTMAFHYGVLHLLYSGDTFCEIYNHATKLFWLYCKDVCWHSLTIAPVFGLFFQMPKRTTNTLQKLVAKPRSFQDTDWWWIFFSHSDF